MTSITNVLTMDETLASRRPGPKYARLPPQSSEVELSEGPQGGSTLGLAAGPTDSDAASLGEFISDSELAVAQVNIASRNDHLSRVRGQGQAPFL